MAGIDYSDYYDHYNAEWRSICSEDKALRLDALLRRHSDLLPPPLGWVLEVGAGDGAVSQALLARNPEWKLCAADISESARELLGKRNIFRYVYDVSLIPEEKQFDLVIACHVLEHVTDMDGFVAMLGSRADFQLIEVPLEDTVSLSRVLLANGTGHINFFRPVTLELFLESRGYHVVDKLIYLPSLEIHRFGRPVTGTLAWLVKKILLAVSPALASYFFSYHMIVLTRHDAS
jgi:SAM-dependent methyltransferase